MSMEQLKPPDLSVFVEVLRTLADQGAIDVEPTEGEYDLTRIYDWLWLSGLARREDEGPYWLYAVNPESIEALAALLEDLKPKYDGEARRDKLAAKLEGEGDCEGKACMVNCFECFGRRCPR